MAFIHPVKAFKNPVDMLGGDSDAAVADGEIGAAISLAYDYFNPTVFCVVFDAVIGQIIDHFFNNSRNAQDNGGSSFTGECDVLFLRNILQTHRYLLGYGKQVKRLFLC